jgi:hypothetical protein
MPPAAMPEQRIPDLLIHKPAFHSETEISAIRPKALLAKGQGRIT